MRNRKLSPSGDYQFGNSANDFWRDSPDAVAQLVKTSLLLWSGEWYLNLDDGTPFMQSILGKHSKATADATLQDRILNIEGVTSISSFASVVNPETRGYSLSLTLETIYGPTTLEVSNYANF